MKKITLIALLSILVLSSCEKKTEELDKKTSITLMGEELKIIAEMNLKPDAFESMKPIFEKVIAGSQAEDGCIYYDLHSDVSDTTNTRFMMIEIWKDQEAIDLHNESPHFKNFESVAKDYIDSMKVTVVKISK